MMPAGRPQANRDASDAHAGVDDAWAGDGISPRATQTTPYGSSSVVREQQLATVFRSAARIYTNGQGLARNALGVTPMIRRNVRLNVDRSPNP
jgi:hypothetical protein